MSDDELNPNTKRAIALPPALVEACQDDPELLVQLTRGQLAVVQDRMVGKVLGDAEATVTQLVTVHEALSRNANIKPAANQGLGSGTQITINFIRESRNEKVVIEGAAAPVLLPPAA